MPKRLTASGEPRPEAEAERKLEGVGSTARLGGCACIAPLPALPQDAWFAVHLLICRDQIVPLMSVNSSE